MEIYLGQKVRHKEIYNGKETMEVVGLKKGEVLLKGDFSGGTHNVEQESWMSIKGLIIKMKNVIITGYTAQSEGVILETNIPARLMKPHRMPSKETFVSWDKIGKLLFEDYTDEVEVAELKELRGQ